MRATRASVCFGQISVSFLGLKCDLVLKEERFTTNSDVFKAIWPIVRRVCFDRMLRVVYGIWVDEKWDRQHHACHANDMIDPCIRFLCAIPVDSLISQPV